jgi:hypothetical protein
MVEPGRQPTGSPKLRAKDAHNLFGLGLASPSR